MLPQLTLASLTAAIPDEAAYDWLESVRWASGPVCPHCGTIGHAYHLKAMVVWCRSGGRSASTTPGMWVCLTTRREF